MSDVPSGSPGANHRPAGPPITLVTVPGLHGSDDTHWQTWLEEQVKRAVRVRQRGRDAAQLGAWSEGVRHALAEISGAVVLASHGFGCLATAHALSHLPHGAFYLPGATVLGVLMVAPGSPEGFRSAGAFDARRLDVPSVVIGSTTDPWMPIEKARNLAQRWNSAFVNLGDAGHIDASAGFGPWPLARHAVETFARHISTDDCRVSVAEVSQKR